jgi:hypothetical protein
VLEISVTESTFGVTALLSGLDAMALSAEENCPPFCRSCTRLLVDVDPLKNVFQSAVISATADAALAAFLLAPLVPAGEEGLAVETAGEEELELLAEQADMAVAVSMRPSIVTVRPRRADRATTENRDRRFAKIISCTPCAARSGFRNLAADRVNAHNAIVS